jgi:hypothetical protein
MKTAAIIMAAALVAGCTTLDSAPSSFSEEDRAFCEYEAQKATASAPGGSINYWNASSTIANDLAIGMRRGELMAACLRARQAGLR